MRELADRMIRDARSRFVHREERQTTGGSFRWHSPGSDALAGLGHRFVPATEDIKSCVDKICAPRSASQGGIDSSKLNNITWHTHAKHGIVVEVVAC